MTDQDPKQNPTGNAEKDPSDWVTGDEPMTMIYAYSPGGAVAHWRQELAGTLPVAGVDVPALPEGAQPQCTDAPKS